MCQSLQAINRNRRPVSHRQPRASATTTNNVKLDIVSCWTSSQTALKALRDPLNDLRAMREQIPTSSSHLRDILLSSGHLDRMLEVLYFDLRQRTWPFLFHSVNKNIKLFADFINEKRSSLEVGRSHGGKPGFDQLLLNLTI